MLVVVWVDDVLAAVKDPEEPQRFLEKMRSLGFTLTHESSLTSFLGLEITRDEKAGTITMTQPGLIDKILGATKMEDCNRNWTPTAMKPLGKDPDGEPMTDEWSYPSIIGMLLYVSTNTRPDIAFAVSQVARFTHAPKQSHATAVKTIVRYLKGTRDKGTILKPDGTLGLVAMPDADFAGLYKHDPDYEPSSAKSRMGYIISLGNCPLVWKSQLIQSITLATAESEYASLSSCLRVLIPIKRVLEEIAIKLEVSAELTASIRATCFEDNAACLQLANTQRLSSRTRYYHTQMHHFWGAVRDKVVTIKKIETSLMDGDYFTKPLPRQSFEANRLRVQGW